MRGIERPYVRALSCMAAPSRRSDKGRYVNMFSGRSHSSQSGHPIHYPKNFRAKSSRRPEIPDGPDGPDGARLSQLEI